MGENLSDEIKKLDRVIKEHEKRLAALEGMPKKPKLQTKEKGKKQIIEDLVNDGFFDQARIIKNVAEELKRRGYNVNVTDISGYLRDLVKEGKLIREKEKVENREQWTYYSK